MGDFVRILGLIMGAFCFGALIVFATAPKGTTAFAPPARYWGIAAGFTIEISGITARIALWGSPFNIRDFSFLLTNIFIAVAVLLALQQPPERKEP